MCIRMALLPAVLIFGSQNALAESVAAHLHCKLTGGEITAHHSVGEQATAPAGFWSDDIDVEIERNAAFVMWGNDKVPALKIVRFRRSKVSVEAIAPINNWKWWVEFPNPGRFAGAFGRAVASFDVWHTLGDGRGDLYFHGAGGCYVQIKCKMNSLHPACIESKPLPELP